MLPAHDIAYLNDRFCESNYTLVKDGGVVCVLVPGYTLPFGYNRERADLMLRLQTGYPDTPPDMWWFEPAILKANNSPIPQADVNEVHLGRRWQRWSRHLCTGAWRSGIDGLESFFAILDKDLANWAGGV